MQRVRKCPIVAAVVLAAGLAGGCAQGLVLSQALKSGYPGYEELTPKLAANYNSPSYAYIPGSLIVAYADVNAQGDQTWNALTDLRCGPRRTLGSLGYWRRKPVVVTSGGSLEARKHAVQWLKDSSGLPEWSLAGVSAARIELRNVRSIEPSRRVGQELAERAAQGCPVGLGVFGPLKAVKGVLIGDIAIHIKFEQNIDALARIAVLDQLSLSLGVAYQRASESEIVGRRVAFGVKWQ